MNSYADYSNTGPLPAVERSPSISSTLNNTLASLGTMQSLISDIEDQLLGRGPKAISPAPETELDDVKSLSEMLMTCAEELVSRLQRLKSAI